MADAVATTAKPLRRIGITLEPQSGDYVWDYAKTHYLRAGDKIVFMHCEEDPRPAFVGIPPPGLAYGGMPISGLSASIEEERKKQVEDYRAFLDKFIYEADQLKYPHEAALLRGDARDAMVDGCDELKLDVLIVGSRGLGAMKRALLGSVSSYCVHHCTIPVVVVHHPK